MMAKRNPFTKEYVSGRKDQFDVDYAVFRKCVDETSNRAERALRPSVICRKVSGGTRSERGPEACGKISYTIHTQRLRKKSFIGEGQNIIKGKRPNPG